MGATAIVCSVVSFTVGIGIGIGIGYGICSYRNKKKQEEEKKQLRKQFEGLDLTKKKITFNIQ